MTDPPPTPVGERIEVNKVAVRVPPFWANEPELWFSQLEAQFTLSSITQDKTKFLYVISQLENKYALEVRDIITNPPESDRYATLKEQLISRLSISQERRIRQLLEHEEIGDRTPSQFLRHLNNQAGGTVPEDFLRTLWMNRLPTSMQAILATQTGVSLTKVAELADKIQETNPRAQVTSISQGSELESLRKDLQDLRLQIAEMSRSRFRGRQRSRSRTGNRNRSRQRSAEGSENCWYHTRFGSDAKKCRPPCKYVSGNEENRH